MNEHVTALLERAPIEARAGNLTLAHVLRAEAVYLGGKVSKASSTETGPIIEAQSKSVIESLAANHLRVASQAKKQGWAYRSVKQYTDSPDGPILAVTNEHPNRQFSNSFPAVTDEDLASIAQLPALMNVALQHSRATDQGLAQLKVVPHLWHLALRDCPHIAGQTLGTLRSLRHVTIDLHRIAANAGWLTQLPNLSHLRLARAPTGGVDELIGQVGSTSTLRALSLGAGFDLTERHLRQLTTGSSLIGVGDGAKRLPLLETLDLSEASHLEERALLHLLSLPALRRLELGRHEVSDTTRARLMAGLPKLKIS